MTQQGKTMDSGARRRSHRRVPAEKLVKLDRSISLQSCREQTYRLNVLQVRETALLSRVERNLKIFNFYRL